MQWLWRSKCRHKGVCNNYESLNNATISRLFYAYFFAHRIRNRFQSTVSLTKDRISRWNQADWCAVEQMEVQLFNIDTKTQVQIPLAWQSLDNAAAIHNSYPPSNSFQIPCIPCTVESFCNWEIRAFYSHSLMLSFSSNLLSILNAFHACFRHSYHLNVTAPRSRRKKCVSRVVRSLPSINWISSDTPAAEPNKTCGAEKGRDRGSSGRERDQWKFVSIGVARVRRTF